MTTTESNPRTVLLTVAQAAERLAIRPSTVRSWLGKGLLPKTKCGRCTRVSADAVEAFISAHTTRPSRGGAPEQSGPFDPEVPNAGVGLAHH
jgi:excisionase family DNA binding protein